MFSLLGVAVGAAYHVVSAYVQVLAPVTGSLATVAAIIAFTMTVRLLPQVADLRKRHAGHPDRLRIELTALYQRENASALAGCLPAALDPNAGDALCGSVAWLTLSWMWRTSCWW